MQCLSAQEKKIEKSELGLRKYRMSQIGLHIIRIYANVTIQCHGLTGNESSRERMFQGANTLECESSRERKFPGHFTPGSESSRERIGQGPIGRFAPGSELARERKGCESFYPTVR